MSEYNIETIKEAADRLFLRPAELSRADRTELANAIRALEAVIHESERAEHQPNFEIVF